MAAKRLSKSRASRRRSPRSRRRLKPALLPHDPLDDRNAIIEIPRRHRRDEAPCVAADLLRMYTRFIERSGGASRPSSR